MPYINLGLGEKLESRRGEKLFTGILMLLKSPWHGQVNNTCVRGACQSSTNVAML